MARESYISPQKFVVFRTAGIVPTIPVPATLRRYHADFLDTDLEIGEWARNIEDNTTFFRNETGIITYIDRTGLKYIEIGDWDMVATPSKTVSHGLSLLNIRNVSVIIKRDDYIVFPIQTLSTAAPVLPSGDWMLTSTVVSITRRAGGYFDSTDFDSISYNRGWVILEYIT